MKKFLILMLLLITSISFAHETREMHNISRVQDLTMTKQMIEYQENVVLNFLRLYHLTKKDKKSKKIIICVMKTHLKHFERNVKHLINPYTGESVYPKMTQKSKKMIRIIKRFLRQNNK